MCVKLHFHIVMTVKKVAKNQIFLKILNFYQHNLTVEFFVFLPAGPKTKADPPDSQQRQDQHEIIHV